MTQPTLAFIGAGNMSQAIFGGLIQQGYDAARIWGSTRTPEKLEQLKARYGIQTSTDNTELVRQADVVILGVKPQGMQALLKELSETLQQRRPLIISVAAGITVEALDRWSGGGLPIIRSMPNTPSLVGTGACGLFANAVVTAEQREIASSLFAAVGILSWVDREALIDAVIAVSGSGPAYYFMMMEAMIAAGEKLGLSRESATELTLQTALGAARMAQESDVDAGELKRRVMSPGGTTEQAIRTFEQGGLPQLVESAMGRCHARAAEMAAELTK
ncbi:pyrroline-5-carboxylate reductase [Aestuariirhabdus litorea]|uniref:Pyrroline-5-carboxylate reductase n=1 Tax=Aestuariirhabdus litorea TaxID=2528527 RepID=A0A3P3VK69_9GAMM|nr:pyrroline-5-carboxylate reductase [Aestuariirhabdus litorea]RRJ82707.1 pyrroline-5-carboxylate reductase [Aestuariirhabdus litorea]RWW92867.1 pyrroline-5-carboxylate reductase [Endozoicomonadaceae bacterium GTF-13]